MRCSSSRVRSIPAVPPGAPGTAEGNWGTSENNRRAKFYELTVAGAQASARRNRKLEPPGHRHRSALAAATGGSMKLLAYASFRLPLSSFIVRRCERRNGRGASLAHPAPRRRSGTFRPGSRRGRTPRAHRVRRPREVQRGMPRSARRQFYRDSDAGPALQPSRAAQVSRIHHRRRFDAGAGHRRQRRGLRRIECADPAPAECASGARASTESSAA
jgi:hypothetical protein